MADDSDDRALRVALTICAATGIAAFAAGSWGPGTTTWAGGAIALALGSVVTAVYAVARRARLDDEGRPVEASLGRAVPAALVFSLLMLGCSGLQWLGAAVHGAVGSLM